MFSHAIKTAQKRNFITVIAGAGSCAEKVSEMVVFTLNFKRFTYTVLKVAPMSEIGTKDKGQSFHGTAVALNSLKVWSRIIFFFSVCCRLCNMCHFLSSLVSALIDASKCNKSYLVNKLGDAIATQ